MKIKFQTILIALSLITVSCTKEESHKDKIRRVITTYLDDMFAKESQIVDYTVDSIYIGNTTPKIILGLETVDKTIQLNKDVRELKLLKKEIQKKINLHKLYKSLGDKSLIDVSKSDLVELQKKFDVGKKLADKEMTVIDEMKIEVDKADSTTVIYHEVIARGKITTLKNVQKDAVYPFHISKEYKILKEPLEIIEQKKK